MKKRSIIFINTAQLQQHGYICRNSTCQESYKKDLPYCLWVTLGRGLPIDLGREYVSLQRLQNPLLTLFSHLALNKGIWKKVFPFHWIYKLISLTDLTIPLLPEEFAEPSQSDRRTSLVHFKIFGVANHQILAVAVAFGTFFINASWLEEDKNVFSHPFSLSDTASYSALSSGRHSSFIFKLQFQRQTSPSLIKHLNNCPLIPICQAIVV